MVVQFTREQRITNALMLHTSGMSEIGFLNGKMGVALYFYYLGRQSGNKIFADFADELIDEVTELLHANTPIDFESGVTGIGWAVEHLIQNGFVDADADDVLEEIDNRVHATLIHGENRLETVVAIGYYYVSRLCYRVQDDQNPIVLDLKYYTVLLVDEIERQLRTNQPTQELLNMLDKLHQLNIFNHKIDKIQRHLNIETVDFMLPFVPRATNEKMRETDIKSPYAGFDLSHIPEAERWGLKSGIAGLGLSKIVADHELQ